MDRLVTDLGAIVEEVVRGYATSAYKAKTYYAQNMDDGLHTVIFVPDADYPVEMRTEVIVTVRVAGQHVIIEQDTTDRPLYEELMRRGIPRENIVLAYSGETLQDKNEDDK